MCGDEKDKVLLQMSNLAKVPFCSPSTKHPTSQSVQDPAPTVELKHSFRVNWRGFVFFV